MKLTKAEIEKAKRLIDLRLSAAGSRFPVIPLKESDAKLVRKYLKSK